MKQLIVLVGTIILGVVLFTYIVGDTNSFKSEASNIYNHGIVELRKVEP